MPDNFSVYHRQTLDDRETENTFSAEVTEKELGQTAGNVTKSHYQSPTQPGLTTHWLRNSGNSGVH